MDFREARDEMVRRQIEARGVTDPATLSALRAVPRERFVPDGSRGQAFHDGPLPIAENQTISQPFVVAAMTEALELGPTSRVLEIGTGCGYQTAVLAEIAAEVFSVEYFPRLHREAEALLRELGLANVHLRCGDGHEGWAEQAPFDAIIATCASPELPLAWVGQLAPGGRLVAPIGLLGAQFLCRFRQTDTGLEREEIFEVRFVPLLGEDN